LEEAEAGGGDGGPATRALAYRRKWLDLFLQVLFFELLTLLKGYPLTRYVREGLRGPGGELMAAALGGFLLWLPYHWFLVERMGWLDLLVVAAGIVIGWLWWALWRLSGGD
jgi:hypothetical protein